MDSTVKHQARERYEGQALDGVRQPLVIAGQASEPGQPAEATLSDPATLPPSCGNRSRCWAMRRLLSLKPTLANPVCHRSLPQLAQPVLLRCVGPDNPAPQARRLLASVDPAAPNPVLQRRLRQPQSAAEVPAPPLVAFQSRAGTGAGPGPGQLQLSAQVPDRLHPEGRTPGRPIAGRVQALGDARGRQALLGPGAHLITDRHI